MKFGTPEPHGPSKLRASALAIEAAMREAARDAVLLHRRLGLPMVTWRDGKVVRVPAHEVELPDIEGEQ